MYISLPNSTSNYGNNHNLIMIMDWLLTSYYNDCNTENMIKQDALFPL